MRIELLNSYKEHNTNNNIHFGAKAQRIANIPKRLLTRKEKLVNSVMSSEFLQSNRNINNTENISSAVSTIAASAAGIAYADSLSSAEQQTSDDQSQRIFDTVDKLDLSDKERTVFNLYYIEGKTMEEIGELLSTTRESVRQTLKIIEKKYKMKK